MNRAFVSENDGWNYCLMRNMHCKDASLRGECERITCKYGPETDGQNSAKEDTAKQS